MAGTLVLTDIWFLYMLGFLAPLLWLWFWLREDPHPESRRRLFLSFLLGGLAVPIALFLEYFLLCSTVVRESLFDCLTFKDIGATQTVGQISSIYLLFGWAFIEEGVKFSMAWWADLKRSVYDEPVDAVIYLITVALGFAAFENALFIHKSIVDGAGFSLILTMVNLRFIGASILHTVASGVVGVSIAFSFFHPEKHIRNIWGGIALATILHTVFNKFIIDAESSEGVFQTFFIIWILAIILIFFFEKIKKLKK